jgi:shikimate dehydrogenase
MPNPANGPWSIEGTTKVVAVLGDPVDHSLSPRMHNAAFKELGLDYVYVAFNPSKRSLGDAVRAVKHLGLAGLNVTVPYKQDVMRYVDRITPAAKAIGAVNTIYADGRKLIGNNTDAPGFTAALTGAGCRPRGKRVLVIGAGGAASAVIHALVEARAADIVIANRTLRKAVRTAKDFGGARAHLRAADLEILDDFDFLDTRQLVVNTTSVGLKGDGFLDYDVQSTPEDCIHFDLAYGEKPTAFLEVAAKAKRPTIDGRHMLLHQGALAFKLFTGRRAPIEVMSKVIGL